MYTTSWTRWQTEPVSCFFLFCFLNENTLCNCVIHFNATSRCHVELSESRSLSAEAVCHCMFILAQASLWQLWQALLSLVPLIRDIYLIREYGLKTYKSSQRRRQPCCIGVSVLMDYCPAQTWCVNGGMQGGHVNHLRLQVYFFGSFCVFISTLCRLEMAC